jgi:hypothetical protein
MAPVDGILRGLLQQRNLAVGSTRAGGILAGCLRVVELSTAVDTPAGGTGPPGRDGEGRANPANVENVDTTPPITETLQPPNRRADAHSKGTDRRGGGKTPSGA